MVQHLYTDKTIALMLRYHHDEATMWNPLKRIAGKSSTSRLPWSFTDMVASVIALVAVAVGLELLTGVVADALTRTGLKVVTGLVLTGLGVWVGLVLVRRVRQNPFDFSRSASVDPPTCEVLVLALSLSSMHFTDPDRGGEVLELNINPDAPDRPDRIVITSTAGTAIRLGDVASINSFIKRLKEEKIRFVWIPALQAVDHHARSLRRLGVVGSSAVGRDGSHDQIPSFVQLLQVLLGGSGTPADPGITVQLLGPRMPRPAATDGTIVVVDRDTEESQMYEGVDFESIRDVHDRVQSLVVDLTCDRSSRWSVAIDATGGTKPASIGAALASLESQAWLQYVNTDLSVTGYNYGLAESPPVNVG